MVRTILNLEFLSMAPMLNQELSRIGPNFHRRRLLSFEQLPPLQLRDIEARKIAYRASHVPKSHFQQPTQSVWSTADSANTRRNVLVELHGSVADGRPDGTVSLSAAASDSHRSSPSVGILMARSSLTYVRASARTFGPALVSSVTAWRRAASEFHCSSLPGASQVVMAQGVFETTPAYPSLKFSEGRRKLSRDCRALWPKRVDAAPEAAMMGNIFEFVHLAEQTVATAASPQQTENNIE